MYEYRFSKREMKAKYAATGKGKGKGKGKATRTPEWKAARREYREKCKALKKERKAAFKEWKQVRANGRRERKQMKNVTVEDIGKGSESVWLVVENLRP